jgi:hypothetical protein
MYRCSKENHELVWAVEKEKGAARLPTNTPHMASLEENFWSIPTLPAL